MAEIAFSEGDFQTAKRYFDNALRLTLETKSLPIALRIAVGIAKLRLHDGDYASAYTWLLYALHHPASSERTRKRATAVQHEVETHLSAEQIEHLTRDHQPLTFGDVTWQSLRHL